jgi:hypothetical protein
MPVMCNLSKFHELKRRLVNFHLNTAYLTYRLTNQSLAQCAKTDRSLYAGVYLFIYLFIY